MANVDLVMRLLAEDRASDKFKKVGDSASVAERRMDKFRKVAGGISAAAITAFAVQSVRAFADAEAQQVKLEGAYKRFPKIADVSIESLRDMNSALQQTTTFDDDAVAGAQAMLAQFNLTGRQIEKVTPLLLDYAAATGKDVNDAAKALGKSFLGQTRALKEVGINYKSTGDAGKDFANITDLLSQKVGGFAEDQGKTAAGQLKILENQFGDLQESIGGALVPAMTALIGVAKPVVEVVGKMPAPVLATGLAVAGLGAAALIAVPKVVAFRAALVETGITAKGLSLNLATAGKAAVGMGALLFTTVGGAEGRVLKPIKATTEAIRQQRDATKEVTSAFQKLQGILDKGAAQDAWVSALGDIGDQAKEARGRLLGNGDAAITLRGQLRDSIGALQNYADGFKNPIAKAAAMRQGIARIRETLIKSGIKPKDVDAFLRPLQQAAEEGYAKGKHVGKSIASGLAAGLQDRAAAIAEATSLGKAAVQAVRRGAEVQSPSKYTTWVGKEIANGLTVGIKAQAGQSKRAIEALTKSITGAAGAMLDKWNEKASNTLSRFREVRDSVKDYGSVTGYQATEGTPTTAKSVTASMAARVAEAKKFVFAISSLRKLGLNEASIREIIAAGPHDGLEIARALLQGGKGSIGEVNRLEAQLMGAGKSLGAGAAQADYGITVSQALGQPKVTATQAKAGGAVTINLTVDGKTIQTVLVDLKRSQGGKLNF